MFNIGLVSISYLQIFLYFCMIAILYRIGSYFYRLIYNKIREISVLKRLSRSGIGSIDKMDGLQFEVYLKALFKELGYKPEVTKKSGDFGVDIVLKGKNRIVIQAKRYGNKNRVGISAVQEVYAGKTYYKANEAWVITNSYFTKQAVELANACEVKLIDRVSLQKFISKVNPEVTPQHVYETVEPAPRKCPNCGMELKIRIAKQSQNKFFGCSNYPNCTHTEPINIDKSRKRAN